MTKNSPNPLPPSPDELDTKAILKASISANKHLAELKGISETIPNQGILINALVLQEAKDSSEIENIITTHDEMYKAELDTNLVSSSAAKEVQSYAQAFPKNSVFLSLMCDYLRVSSRSEDKDRILCFRH